MNKQGPLIREDPQWPTPPHRIGGTITKKPTKGGP